MNQTKYARQNTTTRRRVLLHEVTHAHGLADSCETTTVMCNGVACSFHTFDGWQTHDRDDVKSIYK